MLRLCLMLFAILMLTGCASDANHTVHLWNANELLNSAEPTEQPAPVDKRVVQSMLTVKQRIEATAGDKRVAFFIADGEEPNGFSFTTHHGPAIAVNSAMFKLLGQDVDAMAFLIGHELAHLYLNHGSKRQERDEDRMEIAMALSFVVGMFGVPLPIEAADVVATPLENMFSREEELEADQVGIDYMARAGFDLLGAIRLQQKVASVSDKGGVLASHPSSQTRIQNIQHIINTHQKTRGK